MPIASTSARRSDAAMAATSSRPMNSSWMLQSATRKQLRVV